MSDVTDGSLVVVGRRGGRPRVPEPLVPLTIYVPQQTYDGAVKLANLHDLKLSEYGRRIFVRVIGQSIDPSA